MKFNHTQAKQLLSASEMELFNASRDPALAKLSLTDLKSNVHAARAVRDKFQDLLRRQRLESRDRTGSKDGAAGDDNARTEQKLEALTEILHRFEAQVADVESGAPSDTKGDDKPALDVGELMADVRTAVDKKREAAAAHAADSASGQSHADNAGSQGTPHGGTSESARVARHASHLQETGSQAVQGHVSTQIRRDQAKRDASHDKSEG